MLRHPPLNSTAESNNPESILGSGDWPQGARSAREEEEAEPEEEAAPKMRLMGQRETKAKRPHASYKWYWKRGGIHLISQ
eukprot:1787131-Rhodomonas_salina.1